MPQNIELVKFECPEGHVREIEAANIRGNKQRCEECGRDYSFRKVDLESDEPQEALR